MASKMIVSLFLLGLNIIQCCGAGLTPKDAKPTFPLKGIVPTSSGQIGVNPVTEL